MSVSAPMQSRLGRPRYPLVARVHDDPTSREECPLPEAVRRAVRVASPNGLHMRICSAVVSAVSRLQAKVTVQKDQRVEDADSILGLMSLGAGHGAHLLLSATGPDASEAIETLALLFGSSDG